jgi:hypothetical protein
MCQSPTVSVDAIGLPYAEVPCTRLWDLVEYLSELRINAIYRYRTAHFTVTFPHQEAEVAQQLLNDWSYSGSTKLQLV